MPHADSLRRKRNRAVGSSAVFEFHLRTDGRRSISQTPSTPARNGMQPKKAFFRPGPLLPPAPPEKTRNFRSAPAPSQDGNRPRDDARSPRVPDARSRALDKCAGRDAGGRAGSCPAPIRTAGDHQGRSTRGAPSRCTRAWGTPHRRMPTRGGRERRFVPAAPRRTVSSALEREVPHPDSLTIKKRNRAVGSAVPDFHLREQLQTT